MRRLRQRCSRGLYAGLAVASAVLALGAPRAAQAAPEEPESSEPAPLHSCQRLAPTARFRITLPEEATLEDAVKWMSSVSCLRFIIDTKVRGGKVSIISPEPVTLLQAYNAFHSALQVMGLAVVPAGAYHKIVESNEVSSQPLPVIGPGGRPDADDRYVTKVYRPKSGDVEGVANLMGHFVSKQGSVIWVEGLVIITDTGANIRRMMKIVSVNDKPKQNKDRVYFFPLKHADPDATAELIREVFQAKDGATKASSSARPSPKRPSTSTTRNRGSSSGSGKK